jgi:class 3 adenylate cyclase
MAGTAALALALLVIAALIALVLVQRHRSEVMRAQLASAVADLENLQHACARLAPAGVVQRLIAEPASDVAVAAERKLATAMFVDLVGFTALTERLDPAVLLRLLNGYYQRVGDAIAEHRGQVGSFVGDGIVAYFGAVHPNPWQGDDAVRAALAMRAAIRDYNAELEREGLPRIAIGVGIDRGVGLAGLMGARERREYAFIGRPVNLAARVQALTRIHQVDILVTEALKTALAPEFRLRPMPAEPVKGFAEPVVTYAVEGRAGDPED